MNPETDVHATAAEKLIAEIHRLDWNAVIDTCISHPSAASVVCKPVASWECLPIHLTCSLQPPQKVVTILLGAHTAGAKTPDSKGMYALHHACQSRSSADVIRTLISLYPNIASKADSRGMLPLHHVAAMGPAESTVVDFVFMHNRQAHKVPDRNGKRPLDLAMEAHYPERNAMTRSLKLLANSGTQISVQNLFRAHDIIEDESIGTSSTKYLSTPPRTGDVGYTEEARVDESMEREHADVDEDMRDELEDIDDEEDVIVQSRDLFIAASDYDTNTEEEDEDKKTTLNKWPSLFFCAC